MRRGLFTVGPLHRLLRAAAIAIGLLVGGAALASEGPSLAAPEYTPVDRSFVVGVVGEPKGRPLSGAELERRTHAVGLLLRCPVCQGSAVSDSPSPTAVNMKNEVRDLLAQGFDQEQILSWFEASYGQFVLMEPKTEGINLVVWLGPGVVLLAGLGVVLFQLRRLRGEPDAEALADPLMETTAPLGSGAGPVPPQGNAAAAPDPELERYLQRVRALAYEESRAPSTAPEPAEDP